MFQFIEFLGKITYFVNPWFRPWNSRVLPLLELLYPFRIRWHVTSLEFWIKKKTYRVFKKDKSPVSLFSYSILGPYFLSSTFPRLPAKSLEHKQGLCLPPRDLPRLHPSLPTKGTRKRPSQVLCRHQRWLLQNFLADKWLGVESNQSISGKAMITIFNVYAFQRNFRNAG